MISWLIELFGVVSAVLLVALYNLGFHHLHYPDFIIMTLITPFTHLMNDEEIKGIIVEEGWYQGMRHMLGIYVRLPPEQPSNR